MYHATHFITQKKYIKKGRVVPLGLKLFLSFLFLIMNPNSFTTKDRAIKFTLKESVNILRTNN